MTLACPVTSIGQGDISVLRAQGRITDLPAAVRAQRELEVGGFADAERNPMTWTVYFDIDGQWMCVHSARGRRREWTSLDRLERWLRSMGFRLFYVRNDLDPTEQPDTVNRSGFPEAS